MLVHVLDTATLESERDPVSDLDIIEAELGEYGGLGEPAAHRRPEQDRRAGRHRTSPRWCGPTWRRGATRSSRCRPSPISGLKELSFGLAEMVAQARAAKPKEEATRIVIRPKAVDDAGFTVVQEEDGLFRVRGEKPERWVRQTDFSNDEAVGYLADRLDRLGVEDELMKAGARAGDGVAIGPEDNAVVFDWEPTVMAAGAEMLGRRGEDHRLDEPRPAAQRRRDGRRSGTRRSRSSTTSSRSRSSNCQLAPASSR